MKIVIRMDDITPAMDWEKFDRFKGILDKHGIKPLIGVIPDCKDEKVNVSNPREDFWKMVKDLQDSGWAVAMHGFNHVYTTKEAGVFPIGGKSEFAGLPYYKQDEMIMMGSRILRENKIMTDVFMAPSHSFDRNTIKALKKNGFFKITDGFGIAPYKRSGLIFYPISISRAKTLSDKRDGITTFVYHTNTMDEKEFEELDNLLNTAQVVSYSELMEMKATEQGILRFILEYILAKAKYTVVNLKKSRNIK